MHSHFTVALSLGCLALNAAAFPTTDVLEARDTSMTNTINSYIAAVVQAGFIPNAKPTVGKREDEGSDELAALAERATVPATTPNINLVVSLLEQHGFQPATTQSSTTAKSGLHFRDIENSEDPSTPLSKRTLPDINLVISLLKQHGFVPTGTKTTRSLEARQDVSSSDINTVINELIAQGYNPNDFGPRAQAILKELSLPTETTAKCPQDNNTLYVTGGVTYEVNCAWDYPGSDLTTTRASSLGDCLKACSTYTSSKGLACVAATWAGSSNIVGSILGGVFGNCYMKSNVTSNTHTASMSAGRNINNLY